MNRAQQGYRLDGAFDAALALIPSSLHRLVACDLFIGTDPTFAGVFPYRVTQDGRSYGNTACCAYEHHTSDKRVTVCLPVVETPTTIIHELGHVLHYSLRFEPRCVPVTRYAQTNTYEAFAEAFTAWCAPVEYHHIRADAADVALFESLL